MAAQKKQLNPLLKLVLDIGPLILFFVANSKFGIFAATGAFMVAVLAALAISYVMTRHIAVMPVVTAVIVLIFGGLTLVLHDELFIKLKPTIIYVLFGGTLVGGTSARASMNWRERSASWSYACSTSVAGVVRRRRSTWARQSVEPSSRRAVAFSLSSVSSMRCMP